MRRVRCPHCKEYGFHLDKMPKEVIAVLACQNCEELAVLFRGKIIPLNKRVLESGTLEERKEHLADVIGQFLESGLFNLPAADEDAPEAEEEAPREPAPPTNPFDPAGNKPISDQEMERFLKIDLKCLDNPAYFKRIFG